MLKQETFGRMTNQNGASTLTWTEQYKHDKQRSKNVDFIDRNGKVGRKTGSGNHGFNMF